MKYHQRDNLKENLGRGVKKSYSLLIVLIIIIVFVLISFTSPNIVPGKLNDLGKPIWELREFILKNIKDGWDMLESKSLLVIENHNLQSDIRRSERDLLKMSLLERENEELKSLLGRVGDDKKILARVLSKANQSLYGTLIIDIDDREFNQPSKGQEVFSEEGILIGIIDEVYKKTARIKLLSAPGNEYDVEIGKESIPGLALGLGGGNFEIELPRGVDIEIGDEIISPDLSIKLLGVVEYINSKPQNSMQKILFKSPVNINQIKWILIGSL